MGDDRATTLEAAGMGVGKPWSVVSNIQYVDRKGSTRNTGNFVIIDWHKSEFYSSTMNALKRFPELKCFPVSGRVASENFREGMYHPQSIVGPVAPGGPDTTAADVLLEVFAVLPVVADGAWWRASGNISGPTTSGYFTAAGIKQL